MLQVSSLLLDDLAVSSSLIQQLNSNTLLVFSILGKVKGGGASPNSKSFYI